MLLAASCYHFMVEWLWERAFKIELMTKDESLSIFTMTQNTTRSPTHYNSKMFLHFTYMVLPLLNRSDLDCIHLSENNRFLYNDIQRLQMKENKFNFSFFMDVWCFAIFVAISVFFLSLSDRLTFFQWNASELNFYVTRWLCLHCKWEWICAS